MRCALRLRPRSAAATSGRGTNRARSPPLPVTAAPRRRTRGAALPFFGETPVPRCARAAAPRRRASAPARGWARLGGGERRRKALPCAVGGWGGGPVG